MGRKRSKTGNASSQCSPGLSVGGTLPEVWLPVSENIRSQAEFDFELDKAEQRENMLKGQTSRLKEAGFERYQPIEYRSHYANIIDIHDNLAIVEYQGQNFQVPIKDIKHVR
jgi:hypothetical protein